MSYSHKCTAKVLYENNNCHLHSMKHIDNMLNVANFLHYSITKLPVTLEMQMAIYYHDMHGNDVNYYESLYTKIRHFVDEELVCGLVQLSSMYMVTLCDDQIYSIVGNNVQYGKIMLDSDLAGFADAHNYVTIKSERLKYKFCDDYDYCYGRIKFLHLLLNKKSLYYTETAKELYETSARNNIAMEIEHLKSQCDCS